MDSNFARRTMLAGLRIEAWSASRKDKRATTHVHTTYSSGEDSGRYVKSLLPKDAMKAVLQAANAMRAAHAERTLPWSQDGMRILPSAMHSEYTDTMRRLNAEWQTAVMAFCADYPRYVQDAQARLNGLFDPADYPAAYEIEGFFSVKFEVLPFPDVGDFRVDLADADLAEIKRATAENLARAEAAAMASNWDRLHDVVSKMVERLSIPHGEKGGKFHDTLVGNVRDLCAMLPALNVANDPDLEAARVAVVDKLAHLDPAALRESGPARATAAADATALLGRMSAYTGGAGLPAPAVAPQVQGNGPVIALPGPSDKTTVIR